jgi:hypothetical protein
MRNLRLAGRAATAGLVALLALATVVSARAPVAASGGGRVPARSDNVVLLWDEAALQAIRDTRPAPTVTARALAMVHASIYEAWAAYDPKAVGTRLGGSLRRPPAERTLANKNTAISHAAHRTLVNLFPARSAASAEVLASFTGSQRFGLSVTIPARSSMIEPGVTPTRPVTLTFRTFAEAADQAGRSRRYGGIHFTDGDLDGRRLGTRVGASAWSRALGYFAGTATP